MTSCFLPTFKTTWSPPSLSYLTFCLTTLEEIVHDKIRSVPKTLSKKAEIPKPYYTVASSKHIPSFLNHIRTVIIIILPSLFLPKYIEDNLTLVFMGKLNG